MNLTISGHHVEVSPALREYVVTKLERITRHFDQVVDVRVLLSVEKLSEKARRQKVQITVHVQGKDIFVGKTHEDLYAAIDQLMDTLDRQVCRYKDRVQDHRHGAPKRLHDDMVDIPAIPRTSVVMIDGAKEVIPNAPVVTLVPPSTETSIGVANEETERQHGDGDEVPLQYAA